MIGDGVISFSYLFYYVLLSCAGIYLIKTAGSPYSLSMILGAVLYLAGSIAWLYLLRRLPLSLAFPLASGAMVIGTTVVGFFLLNETIGFSQVLGSVVIVIGVWMAHVDAQSS